MISSNGGVQYYSPDMMAIDDDFPDTTLLSDEDIAAILSSTSTSTMFMDNNNCNNNINGGGEGSALDRSISNSLEEEEKKEQQQQPVIRKRCRASKDTPSTFLIAKACDFRALVQQLTGCQSADSSYKGPINLNFGAAEEDDDTTNHLDAPMLGFKSYGQNSTHPHQEGGQQRLLYEEQESSSNSSSINGGNSFVSTYTSTAPGAYYNSSSTTMTRDDYGDNDLGLDDIFMHEYCSFDYGSEYSSAADHVAITTGDDDNYYSPDYIFPADDESNILFCGY